VLGGGMRQAGVLVAAGFHALESCAATGVDHANAGRLADGLRVAAPLIYTVFTPAIVNTAVFFHPQV
jgi:threonine aldolase